jgi:small subunit ribosomal protein S4
MGRATDAKCKKCRREKEKLFLKGERCFSQKCAIVKRNYAPGDHGQTSGFRLSEFGHQLREKQKAKRSYRVRERQFRTYYEKATSQPGVTSDNFISILESRLDNVLYRSGLAKSRDQARQLISHGHFTVNDRPTNIPSYHVTIGDTIKVKENKAENAYFKQALKSFDPKKSPAWLATQKKPLLISMKAQPDTSEASTAFKFNLIIEHYSR